MKRFFIIITFVMAVACGQYEPIIMIYEAKSDLIVLDSHISAKYINAADDCTSWEVSESDSWISCVETEKHYCEGHSRFKFVFEKNMTGSDREGYITFTAEDYNVSRRIRILQRKWDYLRIGAEGGSVEIPLNKATSESDISCYTDWLSYDIVDTDSGNMLIVSASENTSSDERTAEIRIIYENDETYSYEILQGEWEGLLLESDEFYVGSAGRTLSVPIQANIEYQSSVLSGGDWLSIVDTGAKGLTSSVLQINVAENKSFDDRVGKVGISGGGKEYIVTITQWGVPSTIVLSPSSIDCPAEGGSFELTYTIENPREGLSLEATTWDSWITDITISDEVISFTVAETDSRESRSATVVLSYGDKGAMEFGVFQEGSLSSQLNLSSSASANCYIVSSSDTYKFKTVKGNSSESVGSVASAEVLWESFGTSEIPVVGSLISEVGYEDNYINFSVPEAFREGNAVIAAKDASGTILWSWHIWLTDEPWYQRYDNGAGWMMDRNLGATSDTPGDVGALGLLYQWGRKDPFLGSSSISSSTMAKSTISWPSAVSSNSSNGTIEYATEHPTTFITYNTDNHDWYYTGSSSTDNTRWQSKKTIYDPCPPGYRVPDGGPKGVWSTAFGTSEPFDGAYDYTNEGFDFSDSTPRLTFLSCWYPFAGYLSYNDGSLDDVGSRGHCWSCSPYDYDYESNAYSLYFSDFNGYVGPSVRDSRAFGFSVRCLRE